MTKMNPLELIGPFKVKGLLIILERFYVARHCHKFVLHVIIILYNTMLHTHMQYYIKHSQSQRIKATYKIVKDYLQSSLKCCRL